MVPKTKQQFEEIRAQSRESIMRAALELFAENGFHRTSISMIANKIGISVGLMYNYFKSKNELLEAIFEDVSKLGWEKLETLLDTQDPHQRIAVIIRALTLMKEEGNIELFKQFLSLIVQPGLPESATKIWRYYLKMFMDKFVDTFRMIGVSDPVAETYAFAAMVAGMKLHISMLGEDYPVERVINYVLKKYSQDVN